ncbi:VanZ family protein [Agromyces aurantiacus]|uniref:VanZ family protein n=1 Tax=Agromyces aurantiacus TaxID=165814 RepID=A0ABV9R5B8_9MICO|nr:VanZ family protein [Agromyces aurantiacus]MBM7504006.1 VanZ family protein [Agromyces aurantiacus]
MTSNRAERRLAASARLDGTPNRRAPRGRRRWWVAVLAVLYSIVLAVTLLWPVHVDGEGGFVRTDPLLDLLASWGVGAAVRYPLVEAAGNVLLFVPMGALWVAWSRRPRWSSVLSAAGLATAVSLAAEVAQATVLPERTFDLRDALANLGGAAIGAAITLLAIRSWRPSSPTNPPRPRAR